MIKCNIIILFLLLLNNIKAESDYKIEYPLSIDTSLYKSISREINTPFRSYSKNNQEFVNEQTLDLNIFCNDLNIKGKQLNLIIQRTYFSGEYELLKGFYIPEEFGKDWFLSINGFRQCIFISSNGNLLIQNSQGGIFSWSPIQTNSGIIKYTRDDLKRTIYTNYDTTQTREFIDYTGYIITFDPACVENNNEPTYIVSVPNTGKYFFSKSTNLNNNKTVFLSRIKNIYGNQIEIQRDAEFRITLIRDSLSREYNFNWTAERIQNISDNQRNIVLYNYQYQGDYLVSTEDAEAQTTQYEYNFKIIFTNNNVIKTNWKLTKVIYPTGGYTEYSYTNFFQYFNIKTVADVRTLINGNLSTENIIEASSDTTSCGWFSTLSYTVRYIYNSEWYYFVFGWLDRTDEIKAENLNYEISSPEYSTTCAYNEKDAAINKAIEEYQKEYCGALSGNESVTVNVYPQYPAFPNSTAKIVEFNNLVLLPTQRYIIKQRKRVGGAGEDGIQQTTLFNLENKSIVQIERHIECDAYAYSDEPYWIEIKSTGLLGIITINKRANYKRKKSVKFTNIIVKTQFYANTINKESIVTKTDPDGFTEVKKYDPFGLLVYHQLPQLKTVADTNKITRTLRQNIFEYEYEQNGKWHSTPTKITKKLVYYSPYKKYRNKNGTYIVSETINTYDQYNNLIQRYNSANNLTEYFEYFRTNYNGYIINKIKRTYYYNNGKLVETVNEYDYLGNLLRVYKRVDNNLKLASEFFYEDTNNPGNITKIKNYDGEGNIRETILEYDSIFNSAVVTKISKFYNNNLISAYFDYDFNTLNLISTIDFNGNKTEYTFDYLNRVTKIIFPNGLVKELIYEPTLHTTIIYTKDSLGNVLKIEEKQFGDLGHLLEERIIDPQTGEIHKTKYIYNGRGLLEKKIEDPDNENITTCYYYDNWQRLKVQILPDGTKKIFNYYYDFDTMNDIVYELIFPISQSQDKIIIPRIYDKTGKLIYTYKPKFFNYATKGLRGGVPEDPDVYADPEWLEYEDYYIGGIQNYPLTNFQIDKRLFYDKKGNIIRIIDAKGNITQFEYDELNRKIKTIYPDNTQQILKYNLFGEIIEKTDQNGNKTIYEYNEIGKIKKRIDPLGNITEYKYDNIGNLIQIIDPNGNIWQNEYNEMNKLVKSTDPLGFYVTYEYDILGNRIKQIDKNGNITEYSYDIFGNLIKIQNALGEKIEYGYDNLNRKIFQRDNQGNIIQYKYDAMGNVIQEIDYFGISTKYEYNYAGKITKIIDAKNNVTSYYYDPSMQLVKIKDPLGYITRYKYDLNGNNIEVIDPNGNKTTYEYDSLN